MLEQLIALHGSENIAAVIVEPMSGSAGVILPPEGYLQRLRAITKNMGSYLFLMKWSQVLAELVIPLPANAGT